MREWSDGARVRRAWVIQAEDLAEAAAFERAAPDKMADERSCEAPVRRGGIGIAYWRREQEL